MRSRHSVRGARSRRGSAAPRPRDRAHRDAGRAIAAHGVRSVFDTPTGSSPRRWDGSGGSPRRRGEGWGWAAHRFRRSRGVRRRRAAPRGPWRGREGGKASEHLLAARRPASSLAGAVLDDERAKTRRTDPHPKAGQLVVPDDIAMVSEAGVGDRADREVGLVQRPASTVWHGGSFVGSIHRVEG